MSNTEGFRVPVFPTSLPGDSGMEERLVNPGLRTKRAGLPEIKKLVIREARARWRPSSE